MSTLNRDAELSTLSNAAYMDNPAGQIGDWIRIDYSAASASGFYAVAYRNPQTKQVVVSYRGTDGYNDFGPDLAFQTGAWHSQFEEAARFTARVQGLIANDSEYQGFSLLTTGHSLGGGIAQLMGKMFSVDGASFDAPGASNIADSAGFAEAAARYAPDSTLRIGASFLNYTAQGSPISSVAHHLGSEQSIVNLSDPSVSPLVIGMLGALTGGAALSFLGPTMVASVASTHPMSGIERAMHIAAGMDNALSAGALNMVMMSWSQATGQAWNNDGLEPQVVVFTDGANQVKALVERNGDVWNVSTPDRSTILTLKASTNPGESPTCIVQQAGKVAYRCTFTQDGDVATTLIDYDNDGQWDEYRSETQLGNGASLVQEAAGADGWRQRDWLFNQGQRYDLHDTSQALFADSLITRYFNTGGIDYGAYQSLNQIVADTLVSLRETGSPYGGYTDPYAPYGDPYGGFGSWNLDPIGAFYESTGAAFDPAASIARLTPVLLAGAPGNGTSPDAAALRARDANHDGQLSGVELDGLLAWADANEDGIADPGELSTPAQAGLAALSLADADFYTRGNRRPAAIPASLPPAPPLPWRSSQGGVAWQSAPSRIALPSIVPPSGYRFLRDTDNRYWIDAVSYIDFAPTQVKVNNGNRSTLIGTDGNDVFDASYYAAYPQWINSSLLVHFLAGGGDDLMGGSWRDDTLWGGTGDDVLLGYDGNDRLYGEEGSDELQGGAGGDTLDGGTGNDRLFGQVGNDILYGGDGDDLLFGLDGGNPAGLPAWQTDDDFLDGGAGNDQLAGGPGDDILDGGDGHDLVLGGTGNDRLFGGAGNDDLQGEDGDDDLSGEAGDDKLFGGIGNDVLWGGDGNDILIGFTASNAARQTLFAGESDDDFLYGGAGDDQAQGGVGDDFLDGGEGNDLLLGGEGRDHLVGGSGDDILVGFTGINETRQTLLPGESDDDILLGGAGNDLLLGGLGDDDLWGEAGADELQGGDGHDRLYGGADADRLFGQAGDDILYGGDGDDLLAGFTGTNEARQTLNPGETDNDWLYGGAGNDTLLGGLGNDYLDGGAGADHMEGGQGDDTYIVNSVNDVILEQASEGDDTVISSVNTILHANIEELRLLEGAATNGTGNACDNLLIGNASDNILDGVTGADTMVGGQGNDTYYVDDAGDSVIEQAGEGIDAVQSKISYTLGEHVEHLNLLDFGKPEQGVVDGATVLVYGYPKANELDYLQGDAIPTYAGTCALTSIANLLTQAGQAGSEAEVVQRAIDHGWAVTSAAATDYQRGGSNMQQQRQLLDSYGIRNAMLGGYQEEALANLVRSGRGVLLAVNAGALWGDAAYADNGSVNHVVTVTGVVYGEADGALKGLYIADSGRQRVDDMTRYVSVEAMRAAARVPNAYALYTVEANKLWNEDIDGTGNGLDNTIVGNRGNNVLDGGAGNDILVGGLGDDTYVLSRGGGQDTVREHDATLGNTDTIQLGAGVALEQLWFSRSGNDLQISLLDSLDRMVMQDWYHGTPWQAERLASGDGSQVIANVDLERLVQAMASFAPPAPGITAWSQEQRAALAPILATSV